MIGSSVIWIAFIAAIVSAYCYFKSVTKKKILLPARRSFHITAISIISASVLLMLYILQHRFEYNYIASYSSRNLPIDLLVTTFWAGQEGSFLLWAFFAAVIGIILQRYTRRIEIEGEAMMAYSLVLAFLLLLIVVKSPFQYIWDVTANNVPVGFIPQDGRGLNPLLQNFWMIIHPPVLFLGFASLAVPFVLAISALWQKKYAEWIKSAFPWVLFGAVSLGAGLILGGYWAYGVLGWGGWWGWDPVENSSLIPWMIAVILIHTMLIQMSTGRLVRMNFVLAVLAYLLVIYSTFLTRSGILANASVHSFIDSGSLVYTILLIWLAAIAIGGFVLIFLRWKELKNKTSSSTWLTRESLLTIATIVMGISAAVILFGTSKPLFSSSIVEPSFYDRTNLPIAVLMTLLLGLSLRTKWNQVDTHLFFKKLIIPGILSIILLAVLIVMGLYDIPAALLVFTSVFALFIAVDHGYRVAKENLRFIGGALSHAGLAILFLGIIGSGWYGQKQSISLPIHQTVSIFGYELTYAGFSPMPDGKNKYIVNVERNGKSSILEPAMFESTYSNSIMRNPDYFSTWSGDFYLEPVSVEQNEGDQQNLIVLEKCEPRMYAPLIITFQRFDMGTHGKRGKMNDSNCVTVGAVLQIKTDKGIQDVVPKTTFSPQAQPDMKTAYTKDGCFGFQLVSMNVAIDSRKSQVQINIIDVTSLLNNKKQKTETLIAEVSIKPFMSMVWIAAALVLSGMMVAMMRRLRLSNEKKGAK
jgi:cytochrome c-type biogenesis protein CcmF